MCKKISSIGAIKAWKTIRSSLEWAKKGGLFRNRAQFSLNLLNKGIKNLRHSNDRQRGALAYGDHEFSFDETPTVHVKMHRPLSLRFKLPHIPCIEPEVDFDHDFEFDDNKLVSSEYDRHCTEEEMSREDCEDEEIDLKAEEFIARFYEQIKLQRQISVSQYSHKMQYNHI